MYEPTRPGCPATMYLTDMGYSPSRLAIMGCIAIPGWAVLLTLAWQAGFRGRYQPQVRKRESRLADAEPGEQPGAGQRVVR
jgi:hypothetical protein